MSREGDNPVRRKRVLGTTESGGGTAAAVSAAGTGFGSLQVVVRLLSGEPAYPVLGSRLTGPDGSKDTGERQEVGANTNGVSAVRAVGTFGAVAP